jgi:hypothetical protein
MTLSRFQSLYHNTESPLAEDVIGLQYILQEFPYFYPALALQCRLMKQLGHIDYEKVLSLTAAYAPDRTALYHFIHTAATEEAVAVSLPSETVSFNASSRSTQPEEQTPPADTDKSWPKKEHPSIMDAHQPEEKHPLVAVIQEKLESVCPSPDSHQPAIQSDEEVNPKPVLKENQPASLLSAQGEKTFSEWLKLFSYQSLSSREKEGLSTTEMAHTNQKQTTANNQAEEILPERCSVPDQTTLIDKFIAGDPAISPVQSVGMNPSSETVYSPSEAARQSVEDHQDIASPTLAQIYLMQGHKEKAIEIYRRLILLYPEKSHFFAAEIEKIKQS